MGPGAFEAQNKYMHARFKTASENVNDMSERIDIIHDYMKMFPNATLDANGDVWTETEKKQILFDQMLTVWQDHYLSEARPMIHEDTTTRSSLINFFTGQQDQMNKMEKDKKKRDRRFNRDYQSNTHGRFSQRAPYHSGRSQSAPPRYQRGGGRYPQPYARAPTPAPTYHGSYTSYGRGYNSYARGENSFYARSGGRPSRGGGRFNPRGGHSYQGRGGRRTLTNNPYQAAPAPAPVPAPATDNYLNDATTEHYPTQEYQGYDASYEAQGESFDEYFDDTQMSNDMFYSGEVYPTQQANLPYAAAPEEYEPVETESHDMYYDESYQGDY